MLTHYESAVRRTAHNNDIIYPEQCENVQTSLKFPRISLDCVCDGSYLAIKTIGDSLFRGLAPDRRYERRCLGLSVIEGTNTFAILKYIECMSMTFNKSLSKSDSRV